MLKGIVIFLCLSGAIAMGIAQIRCLTGKELWSLTKLAAYSMMCALVALLLLAGIVILF